MKTPPRTERKRTTAHEIPPLHVNTTNSSIDPDPILVAVGMMRMMSSVIMLTVRELAITTILELMELLLLA
jgi:hypothetical protein